MIVIDGRESALTLSNFANLEEVLTTLMQDEDLEQRVVTDVLVDDESFSELYPHQAEDIEVDSFNRLEIRSVSMGEMAADVVIELPKVIQIIGSGSRQVAMYLRQSELAEGLEILQDIISVSRNLLNTIYILRNEYSKGLSRELDSLGDTLGDLLGEIGDAMSNEDWILVADLMEYEFQPACDGWLNVITELSADIESVKAA